MPFLALYLFGVKVTAFAAVIAAIVRYYER